jgi:hypothetical protein
MGECSFSLDEIRFNVEDETGTDVYCLFRFRGDCPLDMTGWYHKRYPAGIPTRDIHAMLASCEDGPFVEPAAEHWDRARPPLERPGDLPAPAFGSRVAEALGVLLRHAEHIAETGKPAEGFAWAIAGANGALDEVANFTVTDRAVLAMMLERCAANMYRPGEPRPQDAGYRLLGVLDGYIEQVANRGGRSLQ